MCLYSVALTGALLCLFMVAIATPSDYSHHYQQQQPKHIKSSLDNSVMLDTDAGQSSYKRDADSDDEEASFMLHTSWMDWPHNAPKHRSRSSALIGQCHLY